MKVLLFGASGSIGSAVAHELVTRGHSVTAATRSGSSVEGLDLTVVVADAADAGSVAAAADGYDAVVSTVGPRHGVDDASTAAIDVAHGLIDGVRKSGVRRLIVVGGAGSLEVAPGQRLVDTPDFNPLWKTGALAHAEALDLYRQASDLDWTYISPAALIGPGERVGTYRVGADQLLVDEHGESRISYADYAIALVDELERGDALGRRITVAY